MRRLPRIEKATGRASLHGPVPLERGRSPEGSHSDIQVLGRTCKSGWKLGDLPFNQLREDLSSFLADPRAFVPGSKMEWIGIKDRERRAAIIAYLRTLSDTPQPLP